MNAIKKSKKAKAVKLKAKVLATNFFFNNEFFLATKEM